MCVLTDSQTSAFDLINLDTCEGDGCIHVFNRLSPKRISKCTLSQTIRKPVQHAISRCCKVYFGRKVPENPSDGRHLL